MTEEDILREFLVPELIYDSNVNEQGEKDNEKKQHYGEVSNENNYENVSNVKSPPLIEREKSYENYSLKSIESESHQEHERNLLLSPVSISNSQRDHHDNLSVAKNSNSFVENDLTSESNFNRGATGKISSLQDTNSHECLIFSQSRPCSLSPPTSESSVPSPMMTLLNQSSSSSSPISPSSNNSSNSSLNIKIPSPPYHPRYSSPTWSFNSNMPHIDTNSPQAIISTTSFPNKLYKNNNLNSSSLLPKTTTYEDKDIKKPQDSIAPLPPKPEFKLPENTPSPSILTLQNPISITQQPNQSAILKKQLRVIKNRAAAQDSRKRKREQVQNMETQISQLQKENQKLKEKISELENREDQLQVEISQLRNLLFSKEDSPSKFWNDVESKNSRPLSTFFMAFFFSFALIFLPNTSQLSIDVNSPPLLINPGKDISISHHHHNNRIHSRSFVFSKDQTTKVPSLIDPKPSNLGGLIDAHPIRQGIDGPRSLCSSTFSSSVVPSSSHLHCSTSLPESYQDIYDITRSNHALDIPLSNLSSILSSIKNQSSVLGSHSLEDISILQELMGLDKKSSYSSSTPLMLNISRTMKLIPYHLILESSTSSSDSKHHDCNNYNNHQDSNDDAQYEHHSDYPKLTLITTLFYPSKSESSILGSLFQLDLQVVEAKFIGFK